ncbi:hypothetical protein HDF23_002476 [Mucilaginibacter lappiensis]|uniref:Uncharacterized protein n=1 Tax=Mucilaginibacter lappiensis TaxID=354630 RepID=A0ABR6PIW9_9SPHI|nr:hypothetical protein [Mucilaginibacter lappiensis]
MNCIHLIINLSSVILSLISAYLMYKNSPENIAIIRTDLAMDNWGKVQKTASWKNDKLKIAFFLLVISIILQAISNII